MTITTRYKHEWIMQIDKNVQGTIFHMFTQDNVSKLVQSCLIVVFGIHWYSPEKGHSGKPWEFFALLCVRLWWHHLRELRKHVCIDFCQRSCLNCLYENVSVLLPLIHKLRSVYMALQARQQQMFSHFFLCFKAQTLGLAPEEVLSFRV